MIGAQLACTRPLIEAGWFDPRLQIGLSGRTVKPKLIICAGLSGSVQFRAGMLQSKVIVAINHDPLAAIFDVAHLGLVGDIYEVLPQVVEQVKATRDGRAQE
jgi:electron transfer flavoprotein alpha subunit